jgi:hypothetical protein
MDPEQHADGFMPSTYFHPPDYDEDQIDALPEIESAYSEARARGLPDGWTCSIDVCLLLLSVFVLVSSCRTKKSRTKTYCHSNTYIFLI